MKYFPRGRRSDSLLSFRRYGGFRAASVVNPFHNVSRIVDVYLLFSNFTSQLLAMDASARITMKDAAKCDNRCEWQNSVNQ